MPFGSEIRSKRRVAWNAAVDMKLDNGAGSIRSEAIEPKVLFISTSGSELTAQVAEQAEPRSGAQLLMTHPGVGTFLSSQAGAEGYGEGACGGGTQVGDSPVDHVARPDRL